MPPLSPQHGTPADSPPEESPPAQRPTWTGIQINKISPQSGFSEFVNLSADALSQLGQFVPGKKASQTLASPLVEAGSGAWLTFKVAQNTSKNASLLRDKSLMNEEYTKPERKLNAHPQAPQLQCTVSESDLGAVAAAEEPAHARIPRRARARRAYQHSASGDLMGPTFQGTSQLFKRKRVVWDSHVVHHDLDASNRALDLEEAEFNRAGSNETLYPMKTMDGSPTTARCGMMVLGVGEGGRDGGGWRATRRRHRSPEPEEVGEGKILFEALSLDALHIRG